MSPKLPVISDAGELVGLVTRAEVYAAIVEEVRLLGAGHEDELALLRAAAGLFAPRHKLPAGASAAPVASPVPHLPFAERHHSRGPPHHAPAAAAMHGGSSHGERSPAAVVHHVARHQTAVHDGTSAQAPDHAAIGTFAAIASGSAGGDSGEQGALPGEAAAVGPQPWWESAGDEEADISRLLQGRSDAELAELRDAAVRALVSELR